MSEKIVGRKFFSEIVCTLDDDGFWKVHNIMGESRLPAGEEWETTKLEAMSIDKSFERAYAVALDSVLQEFSERTINKGLKSLFDADDLDNNAVLGKETKDEPKDKSN